MKLLYFEPGWVGDRPRRYRLDIWPVVPANSAYRQPFVVRRYEYCRGLDHCRRGHKLLHQLERQLSFSLTRYQTIPLQRLQNVTVTCRRHAILSLQIIQLTESRNVVSLSGESALKASFFRASSTHRFYVGDGTTRDGPRQFADSRLNGPRRRRPPSVTATRSTERSETGTFECWLSRTNRSAYCLHYHSTSSLFTAENATSVT